MRYSASHKKAGILAANSQMWMIRSAATDSVKVSAIQVSVVIAPTNAPEWLLYKVTTALGTATTQVVPVNLENAADAATARLDAVWSTAPTIPALEFDGYATPVSIGSGIVFSWGDYVQIGPTNGLLIVNATAGGATLGSFRTTVRIDE